MQPYYKSLVCLILIFSGSLYGSYLNQESAVVVIVPVADAVATPSQSELQSVEELYRSMPFSPEKGPSCARIHQFIFNEVGRFIEFTPDGKEVLIEFPHVYHENEKRERQNRFWLLSKNIVPLKLLREKLGSLGAIPEPIQSEKPYDPLRFEQILTLTLPWTDAATGIAYSAGTRFKRATHLDNEQSYGIHLLAHGTTSDLVNLTTTLVPREKALISYPADKSMAKKLCVALIKKWAYMPVGSIPYVWGGCSIIDTCKSEAFFCDRAHDDSTSWKRPGRSTPHTGCDCSGLILRAAQIAGLPYFCKNTTTIGLTLTECSKAPETSEPGALAAGDLILIPRHVLMISDIEKPAVAQAIGYSSGYGIVHELPLPAVFENVNNYSELYDRWKNKIPLILKNKKGGQLKEYETFKLLTLA